jgi:hypothetical protein
MGYFKEGRATKRVKLPSNAKYWVELYTDIKWGQTKHALQLKEDGGIDLVMSADKLLEMLIVNWNLDDEKGEVLPITVDNIDRLEPADALFLARESGAEEAQAKDSKKNSPKS